ncbi:MAG: hypothetical protein OEY49_15820 [Candidatus Heimdallarchaeota archaeon]|nr:hypothetical protein [Candidatus Heimdallarchaeota archaeon]
MTAFPEIQEIIWQNPVKEREDDFCEWLAGDEFILEDRYLGRK